MLRAIAVAMFLFAGQTSLGADLRMRIVWEGTLPDIPQIKNPFEHDCRHVDLNADRQFIDMKTKGVRDAVAYVAPQRRDRDRWRQPPRNETVRIQVKDCRIDPHIVVAQAGDNLATDQRDATATHILNPAFFANLPSGIYLPGGKTHTRRLIRPEPAAVPIKCNIHPWEKAFLFVLDHSYIGVSDGEGNLNIRGLPAGTDVPLRFFHEHGQIYSVWMAGQRQQLDKGRLTVHVVGPATDLGDVMIDAESFTQPVLEDE